MGDEHFREQIARLHQEARESEIAAAQNEATALENEVAELWQNAAQADDDGDHETALYYSREAAAKTRELNATLAQLPQPPQYSERKLAWARRRPELVNSPQFGATADTWHRYLTQVVGVADDSDEYEMMMTEALSPQGYEPLATPDELIKTINETSRFCRDSPLTAKTYNKFVTKAAEHTAQQMKAQGRKF